MLGLEDINDSLKSVFDEFDRLCKEKGCFYDITSDEADRQGYLLKDKDRSQEIHQELLPLIEKLNVHLEKDENRKDGVLYTFTIKSITDGYWKKLEKQSDHSLFANDEDKEKVRKGKMPIQKRYKNKLDKIFGLAIANKFDIPHTEAMASTVAETEAAETAEAKALYESKVKREKAEPESPPKSKRKYTSDERINIARNIKKFGWKPEDFGMTQAEVDSVPASQGLPIPSEKSSFKGGKVVRYTDNNGRGLLNRESYDMSKLSESEALELQDYLAVGLQQPLNVKKATFAFTEAGDKQHANLIRLLRKAATNGVKRAVVDTTSKPIWESGDGQIAFDSDIFATPSAPEDQYKTPTGKHRRSQSQYPSSYRPSKTFGGIGPKPTAGNSIPPKLDYTGNIGVSGGVRSTSTGENKKTRHYGERKDATDLPITPPNMQEDMLKNISERTMPGTKIGRTNDNSKRSLNTSKIVPNPIAEIPPNTPEVFSNYPLLSRIDHRLGEDPKVNYEQEDGPKIDTKDKNMMRPLGVFGPTDKRQPSGGPVSNVRVQHPPDRSFDANSPSITVNKSVEDAEDVEDRFRGLKVLGRLDKNVQEALELPEDGYEFMQLLVNSLGMATEARKMIYPDETYIKACDGALRLEFYPSYQLRSGKLIVYKYDKVMNEVEIDLTNSGVVEDTTKMILAG